MFKSTPTKTAALFALFITTAGAQEMDALEQCSKVAAVAEVTMFARQSGIRKDVLLTALAQSPDPQMIYGIITRAYETMIWGDPIMRGLVVIDFSGREEVACLDASGL